MISKTHPRVPLLKREGGLDFPLLFSREGPGVELKDKKNICIRKENCDKPGNKK